MLLLISIALACGSHDAGVAKYLLKTQSSSPYAVGALRSQGREDELDGMRRLDAASRGADGKLGSLTVAEHLRRANVYMTNRAFAEARDHWQVLIERYPSDPAVSSALYGIGRSYFQQRDYEESLPYFLKLSHDFANTKDGREGLYSLASALLRSGRSMLAVARYREYTETYPQGERVESAYLNVIDTFREAGLSAEAIEWVARTRAAFPGTATEANALFARLRLDMANDDWSHAISAIDELNRMSLAGGVMTDAYELQYLRGRALEKLGRTDEAIAVYLSIPDGGNSYHGALATERLLSIKAAARRADVVTRSARARAAIARAAASYPAPYRAALVREATKRNLDARLILAIMRQESGFRERAKSPAAARGLLQLVVDTASKYAAQVGIRNLRDEDLYRPETSILIGSEYLAELSRMFPDVKEAVIASYNGGEDNAARWLKRSGHRDADLFVAEVGFSETKTYVFKVMANYRAYTQLYNRDLSKK